VTLLGQIGDDPLGRRVQRVTDDDLHRDSLATSVPTAG
jgi:hypothetical protein